MTWAIHLCLCVCLSSVMSLHLTLRFELLGNIFAPSNSLKRQGRIQEFALGALLLFPLPPSFPLPLLTCPLPSAPIPFPTFPSPPLRSRTPCFATSGLGERSSSPSGSGQSPAAKPFLVNCRLKIAPVVAMVTKDTSTWSIAKKRNTLTCTSITTYHLLCNGTQTVSVLLFL